MHELAGKGEEKSVLVVSTCPHLRITLEITAKKKKLIWGEKKERKKEKGREKRGRKEGRKGGKGREGGRKKEGINKEGYKSNRGSSRKDCYLFISAH